MSKLPRPKERDIQRQCMDWLKLWGALVVRTNSGAFTVGEGRARRFVRANSEPGCSDCLCVLPGGGFAALEFKRPGNKPTDSQKSFLGEVAKRGGLALVVSSLDGLREALRAEGYDC